jgi:putative membrane protein
VNTLWHAFSQPGSVPAQFLTNIKPKKSFMNTNTESPHPVAQARPQFLKPISNSASITLGIVLVAVGLLIPCAQAAMPVATVDQDFMLAAAQGGMTEVKLGELAATNGQRAEVRDFGQMMAKDHTAINGDLKTLAAQKGVSLPATLDAKHQGKVDKMSALTGAGFDEAYVKGMIKAHQQDAKAFKAELAATPDADLKSFLEKTIPVVEAHLQKIKTLKE